MSLAAAIGLRVLGVGRFLADAGKALLRWIFADWRNGPLLLFATGFFVCVFVRIPSLEGDLAASERALGTERKAHADTVEHYRQAAVIAMAAAQQNVARVEAEQTAITEEIIDDYETRIAAVRARAGIVAGELRRGEARTDPGRAAAAGVPGPGAPAGRAAEAPGDRGLPAPRNGSARDAGTVSALNLQERLIATEQAIQLDALIAWVIAQSEVKTSEVKTSEVQTDAR